MDPLLNQLQQIGLGLATNAIYDYLKSLKSVPVDQKILKGEIQNLIELYKADVNAETVIQVIAESGFVSIRQSTIYAPNSIIFGSSGSGRSEMGDGSIMKTDRTAIVAGQGSFVKTTGNAHVQQNEDGSISFRTGK